jgi:hypothetical protein
MSTAMLTQNARVHFGSIFTRRNIIMFLLVVLALVFVMPTFAQTPVPIEIDTNEIFSQTNNWIDVFLPIVAIGAGISIALAILTFIVKQIVSAF